MRYILLLILAVGCAHAATSTQTVRKVSIDRDGTTTVEYAVNNNSSSSAPGATSQPTTAESNDHGATASASGRQSKPLAAYGLEQRQWIFYGGALALALAGALAMWRGMPTLAYWLFAIAGASLLAETFVSVYATWVVGAVLVGALLWFVKNWMEDSHAIKSATKLSLEGEHNAATTALREAPSARQVKKGK